MFCHIAVVVLISICLVGTVNSLNVALRNLTDPRESANFSVSPPLTDFINRTEIRLLQTAIPHEQVEWVNASSDEPWASYKSSSGQPRRARDLNGKLSRRYIDVTRCPDSRHRVTLRNEVRAITSMILDAKTNMTLSHPIWRALISPAFREEPRALERMKGLFNTLYNIIIDSEDIVGLGCNLFKSQCMQTREDPATGKHQVPAAYYNLNENVVNMCRAFFELAPFERIQCGDGRPLSAYVAMSSTLFHELIHGIFEPLALTNYDFITFDLAYGFGACANLAQGACTTAEAGIRCSPIATIANVDTMVWLVYGFHWYNQCSREGKRIPLY